jgi:hypothetical protein
MRRPKWLRRRRSDAWVGPITEAWYNLGDGADAKKADDLDQLADEGAVIIYLCEAGDRSRLLRAWANRRGWVVYFGDGSPGAASTPILMRRDLARCVSDCFTDEACPAINVGDPGAGPAGVKRKVTNGIKIRRRTKRGLPRRPRVGLSAHLLASATRNGLPNDDKRDRAYHRHIDNLVQTARRFKLAVVMIFGDFNAEPHDVLLAGLRHAGFDALDTKDTHESHRQIDLGWRRSLRRIIRVWLVPGSSDHHALMVTSN